MSTPKDLGRAASADSSSHKLMSLTQGISRQRTALRYEHAETWLHGRDKQSLGHEQGQKQL